MQWSYGVGRGLWEAMEGAKVRKRREWKRAPKSTAAVTRKMYDARMSSGWWLASDGTQPSRGQSFQNPPWCSSQEPNRSFLCYFVYDSFNLRISVLPLGG
eukprot:scaffold909_cov135-Cylindrotheca_fusiformis.AAC.19